MLLNLCRAWHCWILSMEPFRLFLPVLDTFPEFPSVFILWSAIPLQKSTKLFNQFISSLNHSCVRNDLAFDDHFYFPLHVWAKKHMRLVRTHCVPCVRCVPSLVQASVRFLCIHSLSPTLLGAQTARKDLQGKVTLP